jgi:hypothetical protein
MKKDIFISVVIKTESNDLSQPQAQQIERQVDTDQGSKLTRFRAYLPLVVGLYNLIKFIIDKLN